MGREKIDQSKKVLTPEARAYAWAVYASMPREDLVNILEKQLCIQCYDKETDNDFVESIITGIEAGDIELDWGFDFAKSRGYPASKLWFDIDEVWKDG